MKILLYGYYDQGNFGDNLFKFIFQKFFDENKIDYIIFNPKTLSTNEDHQFDLIFLGGGEIINEYFLLPLFKYIANNNLNTVPIYGASIGCNSKLHYINFIDKCIFRNNLSIINEINYFYDNDIVFGLKKYYIPPQLKSDIVAKNQQINLYIPNSIGIYLIHDINDYYYNILKEFMIGLNNKNIIRFIIFEENKDILIINRLIKDGNLNNYEIIQRNNPLEIIDEITKNERHLCLRYHAHIICYLYKLQFLSFPITNKTRAFTEDHDIKYSFNVNEMLDLIISQNIKFKNLEFNFDVLNKFFTINNFTPTTIKSISIWSIFNEIYTNFIKILNNKNNIIDNNNLNYYINYISDQIEFNIIGHLNSPYKYGINTKLINIFNKYNCNNHKLQCEFITIMTDLVQD